MAKKKNSDVVEETLVENISVEPLEEVMGDRYATYAKYVIQDRAIPDVRDGLKPVQRRIIFSMYKNGNFFNRPTKKCAHTVGAVMGTYHPHGDTSIYEALARMSQDWKVRYPLIDFQGNNGSIDGDSPAAYRYTESRLSELSNELIKDIDKNTVDMQLNFDDTEFEPIVLPSRFPNLFVNGTEGIAVALATEIPPHNLREMVDAIIYKINKKSANCEELMQFVKGPDFPGGGIVYESEGLKSIYLTGRGRIEVASKCEIVKEKDIQQIVITEIPYKVVKIQLVYEIDKIIHAKNVDGMLEVRDESDWKGIRIVIDCKKDAKVDLLLKYLMAKTSLVTSYSANMVAIVDGRPRTLSLVDYVESYIAHQVDVITRKSRFDLQKCQDRLHIVEGLILATLNINEVVNIIKASKDKADSKLNLQARYGFSNEQAEAIVTMPLYKLSHSDEEVLEKEKVALLEQIDVLKGILEDRQKLNRVLIRDLKEIANKYGDDRRTQITEKVAAEPIDKRALIAVEDVYISVTRDGYVKRSSVKSYKGSNGGLPGLKPGDILVGMDQCLTTDYLICFTNKGNYITIPVHLLAEMKWKDEGKHINDFATLGQGEKLFKCMLVSDLRNDILLGVLTKFGQIKRMALSSLDLAKHSRPSRFMRLLTNDEIVGVEVLNGRSDLLVISDNGNASFFSENEIAVTGAKAGGIKSMQGLGKNYAVSLIAFDEGEKSKIVLVTDKLYYRIIDTSRTPKTARLQRVTNHLPMFKTKDAHVLVGAEKINKKEENNEIILYTENKEGAKSVVEYILPNISLTDPGAHVKENISLENNATRILMLLNSTIDRIDAKTTSYYTPEPEEIDEESEEEAPNEENKVETSEVVENSAEMPENASNEPENIEETPLETVEEVVEEENSPEETPVEEVTVVEDTVEPVQETVEENKELENAPAEESKPEEPAVVEDVQSESLFENIEEDNPFSDYMVQKAKKTQKAKEERAKKKKKDDDGFEQISLFDDIII